MSKTDLSSAVMEALQTYGGVVDEEVKEAVTATAKECVDDVKRRASAYGWHSKYVNSWKRKIDPIRTGGWNAVIYADKNGYRIAHLLERSHALRNGGRSKAYPHLLPAEEQAEREIFKKIRQKLGG